MPVLETPTEHEFDCLNLNLTIPRKSVELKCKTPVLVFIHGGAFVGGSQSIQLSGREVYDGTSLVRHSIRDGKDIIVATINYRLGTLGFLASRQLVDYNTKHEEPSGNYGLHDQRRALEWLSDFISGFGGDPDNITIQGTSAGAASCHYQSIFPDRKFKRAILASGTLFAIGALPVEKHQERFDALLRTVAPESHGSGSLVPLLHCGTAELTHKITWSLFHPLIDGRYVREGSVLGKILEDDMPDTMVGATAYEEDLAESLLIEPSTGKPASDEVILQRLEGSFLSNYVLACPATFPFDRQAVLDSYGLGDSTATPSQRVDRWRHLLGHVLFDIPSVYTALLSQRCRARGRVWLYYYAMTNPYPNAQAYRKAHHGVNDLLLFDAAPELIPHQDQGSWNASVEQTQKSWIEFVNGESPWVPLRAESSAHVPSKIGPVFKFADDGRSQLYNTLEHCLGYELSRQYEAILEASRL